MVIQNWGLGLASFVMLSGAIAFSADCSLAQIATDGTLGTNVIPTTINGLPAEEIQGGAIRGSNLFHSFQEFNVGEGQQVYFANPLEIENILSRVTGNSSSNILGKLGVLGNANLFLINPNGIIFGPNATLDVKGSFLASTANSLVFDNGLTFSTTNPQAPPLLAINVPLGLQYGDNPGSIQVQGSRLQVPPGETLSLVGGNVSLDGSRLVAAGGRVNLGAVAGNSNVGLSMNGSSLDLSFPDGVGRADVSLTNGAEVNVVAASGGEIAIDAQNLNISGESALRAGIGQRMGALGARAGDIEINTTEAITIANSIIVNLVRQGSVGNAGDIKIATGSLSLTNGGRLRADTAGRGNAGNITIVARDSVAIYGAEIDGETSRVVSQVREGAVGNGGNITIQAESVSLTLGGKLNTQTEGRGNAGNINITASDIVHFGSPVVILDNDDNKEDTRSSSALSRVEVGGVGKSGDINIAARAVFLTDGGELLSDSLGQGNSGNITINARESVVLDGVSRFGKKPDSAIVTGVGSQDKPGRGTGGNITIDVEAGSLVITNGAKIEAATYSEGNAGNITIFARDGISLDGVGSNGRSSRIVNGVNLGAVGTGGNLNLETSSLSLTNSAVVGARTNGQGNGGNITVDASTLEALNGAQIITTSDSSGEAGNITLNVTDRITLAGSDPTYSARLTQLKPNEVDNAGATSGLFANTAENSTGLGGDLTIATGQLQVRDGSQVTVSSQGTGNAGNLAVRADSILLDGQGKLSAETASGDGGNINLQVRDLVLLRRESQISTTAGTAQAGGNGGNITINAPFIVAVPSENSDITANAFQGRGGNINITTSGIFGLQARPYLTPLSDITASSELGVDGVIDINAPEIDPSQGVIELPGEPLNNVEVAQGCQAGGEQGAIAFFNTGRGGLAPNPYEPLSSNNIWEDVPLPAQWTENSATAARTPASPATPPDKIVEAKGWIVNEKGEVTLVAEMATSLSQGPCPLP